MRFKKLVLLPLLLSALVVAPACNSATVINDIVKLVPVVNDILDIVVASGAMDAAQAKAIQNKDAADAAIVQKAYQDFIAARQSGAAQTPELWNVMNAAFSVFEQDSSQVFQLAQVHNANVQNKVNLMVASAQAALAIIETLVPANPINGAQISRRFSAAATTNQNEKAFVETYNRIVVLKTGDAAVDALKLHKLHIHSWVVRYGSAGVLNY